VVVGCVWEEALSRVVGFDYAGEGGYSPEEGAGLWLG
jgi:hypothetical protein